MVDGEKTVVPVENSKGKVSLTGARTSVKVIWNANGDVKVKLGGDRNMIRTEWIDGSSDEEGELEDDEVQQSGTSALVSYFE